jgi:hypothetical protein
MYLLHRFKHWIADHNQPNRFAIENTRGLHSAAKRPSRNKCGDRSSLPQPVR